jgi:beta-hydroxylase
LTSIFSSGLFTVFAQVCNIPIISVRISGNLIKIVLSLNILKLAAAVKKMNYEQVKTAIRNFIIYQIGKKTISFLQKIIAKYSIVENDCFLNLDYFNWVSELENNWQSIRKELDIILESIDCLPGFHDISPDQERISGDGLWKTFVLYGYGIKMKQNCQYCPVTTKLIKNIPGMKTAFFSILLPGKHIPEHCGPYKGILRYQLALKVPREREKCRIRVSDKFRYWSEGKSMMFDDSFPHEAWNFSDEIRVVLFMDIVRPVKFPISILNNLIINLIRWSPYVQDAYKNQQQWDRRLAKIFKDKNSKKFAAKKLSL